MPTAAEVIAQINELPPEERAAFATAFQNDGGEVVKDVRSKTYAKGKADGKATGTEAAAKLAEAQERADALAAELAEVKAKTPDAAAIETRVRDAMQKKLDAEKARADAADGALRGERRKLALAEFKSALAAKQDDGTYIDGDWLNDVAEARWGSRLATADDGSLRVLQLDGDMTYDAPDVATAVRLLAADARKTVPAKFVVSSAESGAGATNGGGGYGGGYDPVAAGKAMAQQQSAQASTSALALK